MPLPPKNNTIILAIDPGFDRVGWAIGNAYSTAATGVSVLAFDCIQTDKENSYFERLEHILLTLAKIIATYKPNVLAIETLGFGRNVTTAIPVSQARGAIIGLAIVNHIPIAEYAPTTIKQTLTGHGHAEKAMISQQLLREFKIPVTNVVDDALDAIAVMITHHVLSQNKAFQATTSNTRLR